MKTLISIFLTGFTAFSMMACSMSKDDSHNTDPSIVRQNQYIDGTYGPIIGTYMGSLVSGHETQQVRMIILIKDQATHNSDGTPTTTRVPSATFTRLQPIGRDFTMTVSYTPQTGSISFVTPASPNSGGGNSGTPGNGNGGTPGNTVPPRDDDVATIAGAMTGLRITGDATSIRDGRLGAIDMVRTTTQTDLPGDDRNDRRRRLYETLVGQYCGKIADPYDRVHPQIISLKLKIDAAPDTTSPTGTRPILAAFYERLDKAPGVIDLAMGVNFENPPSVVISGHGLGNYAVSFTGTLTGTQIEATLSTAKDGPLGNIVMKKDDPLCRTPRPNNPILPK
jgi:hypothetical protein